MGEVFRADDLTLGVAVALVAREVAHPNVCRVYDIAEVDGEHFISMEFIEGEDLAVLLRRIGRLPEPKTIEIARQLCHGLTAAHDKGVVHRDLKPANIMLDDSGDVRITDFGIALLDERGEGGKFGSPAYMAPEQFTGGRVSPSSDIYSLGLVLYEIFTGAPAILAESTEGIDQLQMGSGPAIQWSLLEELDPGVEQVIRQCLERDPGKRPASADAVAAALPRADAGRQSAQRAESREPESGPSIAVLPFADMSPEKDQEYFCEGMAEEIINSLSRIEGVHVASRTSSFQFRGSAVDIRVIGKQLNVRTVLEGSVRKAGDRLRVTSQLINVADGYHLWSERYDRQMKDVFAIQDEIAGAIVTTLKGRLSGLTQAAKRYTDNVDAYELYMKGRYVEKTRSQPGFVRGIEYFEQAIEKDPGYAMAYAGLSDSYSLLAWYRFLTPSEAFSKAGAAATKAVEIDDTLPEAHTSQGVVRFYYDRDWAGAEESFRRALELNDRDPIAMHAYAEFLAARNRLDEATAMIGRAHQLDPLSLTINAGMAWVHYFCRRYDEAIGQLEKTLDLDPHYVFLYWFLGQAYLQNGVLDKAIDAFRRGVDGSGRHAGIAAYLAHAYGRAGRLDEAHEIMHELRERAVRSYIPADYMSVVALGLGRTDEALRWMEKACAERSLHLVFLGVDPLFDGLRSEGRYKQLMAEYGLEVPA
jgi:serine/threonine-protein kinase